MDLSPVRPASVYAPEVHGEPSQAGRPAGPEPGDQPRSQPVNQPGSPSGTQPRSRLPEGRAQEQRAGTAARTPFAGGIRSPVLVTAAGAATWPNSFALAQLPTDFPSTDVPNVFAQTNNCPLSVFH